MITAIITLTLIGLFSGFGLAMASKKFSVEKDPRLEQILDNLPGTNCGACGNPGCEAMSRAILGGKQKPTDCPSASSEMIKAISELIGLEVEFREKLIPRLACAGDKEICKPTAEYQGLIDCSVMDSLAGAGKPCRYGCMGGGSCVEACQYDAIFINDRGLPEIIEENCTSCGLCVLKCPRNLLTLKPISRTVQVLCSSKDRGPEVRKICSVGCIACSICVKACPEGAITIIDNVAVIDSAKCTLCLECVPLCPTKSIVNIGK